jgi:hypothetical protein
MLCCLTRSRASMSLKSKRVVAPTTGPSTTILVTDVQVRFCIDCEIQEGTYSEYWMYQMCDPACKNRWDVGALQTTLTKQSLVKWINSYTIKLLLLRTALFNRKNQCGAYGSPAFLYEACILNEPYLCGRWPSGISYCAKGTDFSTFAEFNSVMGESTFRSYGQGLQCTPLVYQATSS